MGHGKRHFILGLMLLMFTVGCGADSTIRLPGQPASDPVVSDPLPIIVSDPDPLPPSRSLVTVSLAANAMGPYQVDLSWSVSSAPNGSLTSILFRDGVKIIETSSASHSDMSASQANSYEYEISLIDSSGSEIARSAAVQVAVPPDMPPSQPLNLMAEAATTSVYLSWDAASDDLGVAGYIVKRDNVVFGTVTTLGFFDSPLASSTSYSYVISTIDNYGNLSAPVTLSVTTDTPPSTPTGGGTGRTPIYDTPTTEPSL